MRRLTDFLAPLGLVIIFGSLLWHRMGRDLPGDLRWYVLTGAALVVAHLLLRGEDLAQSVGGRQLRHGGNAMVLTIVVLAILVLVNGLAFKYNERIDLTENRRHSLSPQTRQIVSGLQDDVKITYFADADQLRVARLRLQEYEALGGRLSVKYINPLSDPVMAQRYDAYPPYPVILVERGDRRERLTRDSEQDLTNALIKVFRDEVKAICFVEGQGERDPGDDGELGFSLARQSVEESQYSTQTLPLMRDRVVPEQCAVVVLAGPQVDLLPPAIDALRAFAAGGGSVLVMAEPPSEHVFPNLEGLLGEWGIEVGADFVIDVSGVGQLFGGGALMPIAMDYPGHEITKGFRIMTAFSQARSVQAGSESPAGVFAQNLLRTSDKAWAETDLTLSDPIEPNEGQDQMGPVSMGAVATIRAAAEPEPDASPVVESEANAEVVDSDVPEVAAAAEPDAPEPREGRVVAYGDVDFASNGYLGIQGNRDLFLNSIAWLAEDADLISIRPREPKDQRLFLTQLQQGNAIFIALVVLPGIFIGLGVFSWWRRR